MSRPRIRPNRVVSVAVTALVAVAAGAGCGGGGPGDDVVRGGPLAGAGLAASGFVVGDTQNAGREVMFGLTVVVNDGDAPATLRRARIVDLDPGLELTDTYAAGPDRRETWALEPNWPNRRDYPRLHPVDGYVVPPGGRQREEGVQLLFILRTGALGKHRATKVTVDYTVGDKRFRRTLDTRAVVCVVAANAPRKCPGGNIIRGDRGD